MLSSTWSIALAFGATWSLAACAKVVIYTPPSLVQCEPVSLGFKGGKGPYNITIIPGGQPEGQILRTLPLQEHAGRYNWTVDLAAGTVVTLQITDGTGVRNWSDQLKVGASDDVSCVKPADEKPTGKDTTTSSSLPTASNTVTSGTDTTKNASSPTTTSSPGPAPTKDADDGEECEVDDGQKDEEDDQDDEDEDGDVENCIDDDEEDTNSASEASSSAPRPSASASGHGNDAGTAVSNTTPSVSSGSRTTTSGDKSDASAGTTVSSSGPKATSTSSHDASESADGAATSGNDSSSGFGDLFGSASKGHHLTITASVIPLLVLVALA